MLLLAPCTYLPDFIPIDEADRYYQLLRDQIDWKQEYIRIFGKQVSEPRLTALYGDEPYKYSGKSMIPTPWTSDLIELKNKIEHYCKYQFNTCLLNYYRSGTDSMGWHSDDEKELGPHPVIASLSLGTERKFELRKKSDKTYVEKIMLQHGSLLMMGEDCQATWQHHLPKMGGVAEGRINLTFRQIY